MSKPSANNPYSPPDKRKGQHIVPIRTGKVRHERTKSLLVADESINSVLSAISRNNIEKWITELASFHTRHTKSKYIDDITTVRPTLVSANAPQRDADHVGDTVRARDQRDDERDAPGPGRDQQGGRGKTWRARGVRREHRDRSPSGTTTRTHRHSETRGSRAGPTVTCLSSSASTRSGNTVPVSTTSANPAKSRLFNKERGGFAGDRGNRCDRASAACRRASRSSRRCRTRTTPRNVEQPRTDTIREACTE